MPSFALYLGLVAALAIGFWQGVRFTRSRQKKITHSLNHDYFQGLNFLLNEEPDAAIDTFIKALEVNSETLDTHLALAKLLRKRGEVDRAIRIHQNLLARPGLTKEQSQQAQYELATDFTKAGLLDRAEGLLTTLTQEEGAFQTKGLIRLLGVYRDEREWQEGLQVLQKLSGSRFSKTYDRWAPIRGHFCCELAEQEIIKQCYEDARQWLKQALSYDKNSPRANLLLGRLEIAAGNTNRGIQQLQKIAEQTPEYLSEALPYIADGYRQIGGLSTYHHFLKNSYKASPEPIIVAELVDIIALQEGEDAAAEFITSEVTKNPSNIAFDKLLDYSSTLTNVKNNEYLKSLQQFIKKGIANSYQYQCHKCGFKGQKLHWLCPSCKHWGNVKPIKRLGE
jgi:lipopolysaccharide biosynthesis regulator YciM